MSKVISFSISDKYLEKLRTLYPALTDNLAVKQFVTDRLESSLGNSLDGSLYGDLDGKIKTLIESELDGLLEGRLDAVMGKSLTSLSERMARLEARLDTNLDGGLDDKLDYGLPYQPTKNELTETQRRVLESRQLAEAKLKHAAYLVKHPLVVRDLSKKQPIAVSIETVETADTVEIADKVESVDESVTSPLPPNQETVESDSTIEPDKGAIGPVPGEGDSINKPCKGMTAKAAVDYLKAKKVVVSYDSLHRWISREKIPDTSPQGKKVQKYLTLINKLYYPKID